MNHKLVYIYEFGKARFVKRNDNSCMHTRDLVTLIILEREIDRWNIISKMFSIVEVKLID